MAGGGYYPLMSDLEWANAPFNEPQISYDICPDCNGDGGVWYDLDGNKYDVADYERLSQEDKDLCSFEYCERCGGEGKIDEPYEPDWDDYDD